ncbi:hypothetical protein ACJX0J_012138, partial [Zea mays]
ISSSTRVNKNKACLFEWHKYNRSKKYYCVIMSDYGLYNRMVGPASCGEMLWQLFVAACGLQQRDKIVPTSVNFFTGFRKTIFLSTLSEQPIADHMQDDYWADILINMRVRKEQRLQAY